MDVEVGKASRRPIWYDTNYGDWVGFFQPSPFQDLQLHVVVTGLTGNRMGFTHARGAGAAKGGATPWAGGFQEGQRASLTPPAAGGNASRKQGSNGPGRVGRDYGSDGSNDQPKAAEEQRA
jgi:hypothetical protein